MSIERHMDMNALARHWDEAARAAAEPAATVKDLVAYLRSLPQDMPLLVTGGMPAMVDGMVVNRFMVQVDVPAGKEA